MLCKIDLVREHLWKGGKLEKLLLESGCGTGVQEPKSSDVLGPRLQIKKC